MYVKLTKNIEYEVQNNIDALYRKQANEAENWFAYGMDPLEFDMTVINSAYPAELRVKINDIGELAFEKASHLNVKIPFMREGTNTSVQYTAKFVEDTFVPEKWKNNWSGNIRVVKDPRIVEIVTKRDAAMRRVTKERDEFKKKVQDAMDKVVSVNEMVKLWPAFEDFLSDDTKERLHRKVVRSPSAKKDVEDNPIIDTHSLSVHMLKAKVLA